MNSKSSADIFSGGINLLSVGNISSHQRSLFLSISIFSDKLLNMIHFSIDGHPKDNATSTVFLDFIIFPFLLNASTVITSLAPQSFIRFFIDSDENPANTIE